MYLTGFSFTVNPGGCVEEGSGDGQLSPLELCWRDMEGGSYTGEFERRMMEDSRFGASLSKGAPWGELGRRATLLGTPKDVLSKALEMGVCCLRGSAYKEHGGTFLSQSLWEKGKSSLMLYSIHQHNLFLRNARLHVSTKSQVIFRPVQYFRYQMLCPLWDPIVFTILENI